MRGFRRKSVRRQHDLIARLVYRVKGVEELVLRKLLRCKELNVIDKQKVNRAVLVAKFLIGFFADCGN